MCFSRSSSDPGVQPLAPSLARGFLTAEPPRIVFLNVFVLEVIRSLRDWVRNELCSLYLKLWIFALKMIFPDSRIESLSCLYSTCSCLRNWIVSLNLSTIEESLYLMFPLSQTYFLFLSSPFLWSVRLLDCWLGLFVKITIPYWSQNPNCKIHT